MGVLKNNPNFRAIYQDYNWCYQKFIIEGLNHQEMADECGATKRVIEKWCTEKHRLTQKFRQKNKQLSSTQKDIIIGSMLGDGHINKRETQPLFIISHAENQKDYLFWKYEILKDLCNIPPTYYEGEIIKHFNDKEYSCQSFYRLGTRLHDCLIPIRNMDVYELVNSLNELSFSVLMLDDGHRSNIWGYCVAPYTNDEKEYMIKVFKDKFDINGYVRDSDNRYMFFSAIDSKKIDNIILNNIPNELDVVKDKIIYNNNIKELCNYRMVKMNDGTELGLSAFCKLKHISNNKNSKSYKFLIDAFDNKNITTENELYEEYWREFNEKI